MGHLGDVVSWTKTSMRRNDHSVVAKLMAVFF